MRLQHMFNLGSGTRDPQHQFNALTEASVQLVQDYLMEHFVQQESMLKPEGWHLTLAIRVLLASLALLEQVFLDEPWFFAVQATFA